MKKCLQHKERKVYARGRCESCYRSIIRRMKEEGLTDRQMVQRRYLLPRDPRWKPRKFHEVHKP